MLLVVALASAPMCAGSSAYGFVRTLRSFAHPTTRNTVIEITINKFRILFLRLHAEYKLNYRELQSQAMKKLLPLILVGLSISRNATAQSLDPNRRNSLAVQNIISSRVYRTERFVGAPGAPEPFFSDEDASLDYAFKRTNSKLSDNGETDAHSINPGLYLEYDSSLSITAGFLYKHSESEDDTPSTQRSDLYSPIINVDEEILHFFGTDPNVTSLTLEADFAYSHIDGVSHSPTRRGSTANLYDFGPTVIFVQRLLRGETADKHAYSRLALSVIPTYDFEVARTTFDDGSPSQNSHTGLFSLTGRLDFGINEHCFLQGSATWNRDINQSLPTGQTARYRNWAQFGAGFVWKPNSKWILKAGYLYEAFHPDYDSHTVVAHAEFHF